MKCQEGNHLAGLGAVIDQCDIFVSKRLMHWLHKPLAFAISDSPNLSMCLVSGSFILSLLPL